METKDYLKYIVEQIHSTVMATVDDEGLPVTCAIDIMDYDEKGLYFLTAKGNGLYGRLKRRGYVALTGMKGADTMSCVAVSLRGKIRELGSERMDQLFEKNPYMYEIYPDAAARSAITVFQIYEGTGEWFDLSKKPLERATFAFGGADDVRQGYYVTDKCIGCNLCYNKCPTRCIDTSTKPVVIHQENCGHCGNCLEICPAGAVIKLG